MLVVFVYYFICFENCNFINNKSLFFSSGSKNRWASFIRRTFKKTFRRIKKRKTGSVYMKPFLLQTNTKCVLARCCTLSIPRLLPTGNGNREGNQVLSLRKRVIFCKRLRCGLRNIHQTYSNKRHPPIRHKNNKKRQKNIRAFSGDIKDYRGQNNLLLVSSLVFTTNIVTAAYKQHYIYSGLFTLLTITSLIFHSNKTLATNIADKLLIGSVVFYGGNMFYEKIYMSRFSTITGFGVVTTFMVCIIFFYYGYICNKYCFDPDRETGNIYHALLHIISSVGHHMIIMS